MWERSIGVAERHVNCCLASPIEAMQEVLANAIATGAPLHIVHVNSMALGEIDTVLDLIGGARRLGLDATTEAYYPYTAGSTSLHSSIFDEGRQLRSGGRT